MSESLSVWLPPSVIEQIDAEVQRINGCEPWRKMSRAKWCLETVLRAAWKAVNDLERGGALE